MEFGKSPHMICFGLIFCKFMTNKLMTYLKIPLCLCYLAIIDFLFEAKLRKPKITVKNLEKKKL